MELAVLILVNLVTGGILYVLFSLRFTVAVEKAKKEAKLSAVKELKQNVEQTIRLMDDTLEIMDQKLTTFYTLVRKSEELALRLENSEGKISSKKTSRKKKSEKLNESQVAFNSSPLFRSDEKGEIEDDKYMKRLLSGMSDDKMEIASISESSIDIFSKGELSRKIPTRTESSGPASAIEKLGGLIRGAFGIKKLPLSEFPEKENSYPSKNNSKNNNSQISDDASHASPGFSALLNESVAKADASSVEKPAESKSGFQLKTDYYEGSELSADEIVKDYYETSDDPDRRELVHILLSKGFDVLRISKSIQMNRAEVELIASMPFQPEKKARKLRISDRGM